MGGLSGGGSGGYGCVCGGNRLSCLNVSVGLRFIFPHVGASWFGTESFVLCCL